MHTCILVGQPKNLYVFDFGSSGSGSAPCMVDVEDVQASWEPVGRNIRISSSRGTLYRPPENQRTITVIDR